MHVMVKSLSSKPMIKDGWLRVLLFILALIVASVVGIGAYIVSLPKGSTAEAILQSADPVKVMLILCVLSLIVTFVFRRLVDRKSFVSLGLDVSGYAGDAISGAALGIFIVSASSLILKVSDHLKWTDIIFDPKAMFMALGFIVVGGFLEELVFRGYILGNLMSSFSRWLAIGISAILFMIFHWSTLGFFPLLNTLIIGIILGLNYSYTRNLWFSVCFHIAWKFMEGPMLGFPGGGITQSLLQTELQGDENITGAASGLEGSVMLTAVSLLSLIALYLFLQRKISPQSRLVPGRI
jgi:uncharacterized protein